MAVYSNIVVDQGSSYTASIDVTDTDGDNIKFNLKKEQQNKSSDDEDYNVYGEDK